MREFFKENDIISAEVQNLNQHGQAISIQTRNLKYGKLYNGFSMEGKQTLVRKMKNHYLRFGDILVILGVNGYVWISYSPEEQQQEDLIETYTHEEMGQLNV